MPPCSLTFSLMSLPTPARPRLSRVLVGALTTVTIWLLQCLLVRRCPLGVRAEAWAEERGPQSSVSQEVIPEEAELESLGDSSDRSSTQPRRE